MPATKASIIGFFAALLAAVAAADTSEESQKAMHDLCQNTDKQQICMDSLSKATNSADPKILIQTSFQQIIKEVENVIQQIDEIRKSDPSLADPRTSYGTCQHWLGRSIDDLQKAADEIGAFNGDLTVLTGDIQTYITGASTYQSSCMDCFEEDPDGSARVEKIMKVLTELTVNGLAMANGLPKLLNQS